MAKRAFVWERKKCCFGATACDTLLECDCWRRPLDQVRPDMCYSMLSSGEHRHGLLCDESWSMHINTTSLNSTCVFLSV